MNHLSNETVEFFHELAVNNTTAWFDANRQRYRNHVQTPMAELATTLVGWVAAHEDHFVIDPSKTTYRIHRDLRFSKDPTPYKTDLGITIMPTSKNDMSLPGYTLRIGVSGVSVAGGLYKPTADGVQRVRTALLADRGNALDRLTSGRFADTWGALVGETNKRLPAKFADHVADVPLLANKQWVFWMNDSSPDAAARNDLVDWIVDAWDVARPVNTYLHDQLTKETP